MTFTVFSVSELVNLMAASEPGWPRRSKPAALTNGGHHMAAKADTIGRRRRAHKDENKLNLGLPD